MAEEEDPLDDLERAFLQEDSEECQPPLSPETNAKDIVDSSHEDVDMESKSLDDLPSSIPQEEDPEDFNLMIDAPVTKIASLNENKARKAVIPKSWTTTLPIRAQTPEELSEAEWKDYDNAFKDKCYIQEIVARNHTLRGKDYAPNEGLGTPPRAVSYGDLNSRYRCKMVDCSIHDQGKSPELVLELGRIKLLFERITWLDARCEREVDPRQLLAFGDAKAELLKTARGRMEIAKELKGRKG